MDSEPPAVDVDVRISTGERHGFGASAPSPTRTSSLLIGRAGGLTTLPKLVELVGPSTAGAEGIPRVPHQLQQRPPCACKPSCLFLRLSPGRDVAAELDAAVLLDTDFNSSPSCLRAVHGRSQLSIYRNSCPVLLQLFEIFPPL